MKILQKKIQNLIPADYNPRQLSEDQFEQIKDSLKEFGFVDPVIINSHETRQGVVIGGHQRLKAWEALGNKTVPVVEVSLTLEKEKELNIRLNKATGEWDWDVLANQFEPLDLMNWGFTDKELGVAGDLEFETENNEEDSIDFPEGMEASHVRMIQLYFNDQTEPEFRRMELALRNKFKTDNATDTVFACLKELTNG